MRYLPSRCDHNSRALDGQGSERRLQDKSDLSACLSSMFYRPDRSRAWPSPDASCPAPAPEAGGRARATGVLVADLLERALPVVQQAKALAKDVGLDGLAGPRAASASRSASRSTPSARARPAPRLDRRARRSDDGRPRRRSDDPARPASRTGTSSSSRASRPRCRSRPRSPAVVGGRSSFDCSSRCDFAIRW